MFFKPQCVSIGNWTVVPAFVSNVEIDHVRFRIVTVITAKYVYPRGPHRLQMWYHPTCISLHRSKGASVLDSEIYIARSLPNGGRYIGISVGLLVLVNNITGQRMNFHWIFRIAKTWYQDKRGTCWGCSFNPLLEYMIYFLFSRC